MSLRRKDDWDEALEEAYWNAVHRGEIKPKVQQSLPKDYNYGMYITISRKELEDAT